jgi:hypothetical protein
MPAPRLRLGATVMCSHAGQATARCSQPARHAVVPTGRDVYLSLHARRSPAAPKGAEFKQIWFAPSPIWEMSD